MQAFLWRPAAAAAAAPTPTGAAATFAAARARLLTDAAPRYNRLHRKVPFAAAQAAPATTTTLHTAAPWPAAAATAAAATAAAPTAAAAAARRSFSSQSASSLESMPSDETPNPNALKFRPLLPRPLVNARGRVSTRNFTRNSQSLADSPMAEAILQVEGVVSVLIGAGFVSVVKSPDAYWETIRKPIEQAIRSSATAQLARAAEAAAEEGEAAAAAAKEKAAAKAGGEERELSQEDKELFEAIKDTLYQRVRPMLQGDGGDLEVLRFDFESGQLYVHLLGSCRGCPSSTVTVKRGMEQMLKYYYPEVEAVIECDENGEPLEPEDDE